jgi:tripartite-type tricarboxylate transporter receptor subunit TctC
MSKVFKQKAVLLAGLYALCVAHEATFAQAFPSKPIRIITQFAAGSGGDAGLRITAAAMSEALGQPVVIENRAGAGGIVAAEAVARTAPADGYTLLASSSAVHVMRVFIGKVSFDPIKDFQPITQLTQSTAVVIAHPSLPVNTPRELVEYARKNPGKLSIGTSGVGSDYHLAIEQIKMLMGVDLVHVPYKAGAQAMLDVVSGQLPISFSIYGPALPLLKSGKLKAIALMADKRHPILPNVETVGEGVPNFVPIFGWMGLFTATGLPPAILARLSGETIKAHAAPAVRAKMNDVGFDTVASTPDEFAAALQRQIALVDRIVKAANIKLSD